MQNGPILVNLGSHRLASVTLSGGPNHTMNHYAWFAKWLKIVASSWMHHPTVHTVSHPSKCGWSLLHCDINPFLPNHMAVAWDVGCSLSFRGGRSCQFLFSRSRATVSDIIVVIYSSVVYSILQVQTMCSWGLCTRRGGRQGIRTCSYVSACMSTPRTFVPSAI